MSDVAGLGYNKRDNTRTRAGIIGNADGPKKVEGKVNIRTSNKTNMIPILINY